MGEPQRDWKGLRGTGRASEGLGGPPREQPLMMDQESLSKTELASERIALDDGRMDRRTEGQTVITICVLSDIVSTGDE